MEERKKDSYIIIEGIIFITVMVLLTIISIIMTFLNVPDIIANNFNIVILLLVVLWITFLIKLIKLLKKLKNIKLSVSKNHWLKVISGISFAGLTIALFFWTYITAVTIIIGAWISPWLG